MDITIRKEAYRDVQPWITGVKHQDSKRVKRDEMEARRRERGGKREIAYEMFTSGVK